MAGPYSISYDPTQDPGERLAPEVREEIAEVAPSTVTDGSIIEDKLAEGAVTSGKIADRAVGTLKIATGAVTSNELAADAVNTADVADNAITGPKAGVGVITSQDAAGNYVETAAVFLTATQYSALTTKDPNTLYFTTPG